MMRKLYGRVERQNPKNISEKNNYFKLLSFLILAVLLVGNLPLLKVSAAGTITGRVFQDYNGNGNYDTTGGTAAAPEAIDTGVSGVTVTAYDSNGAAQGAVTSAADGTYSLGATGTGPYRLEFTTLPTGFQPSARNTNSLLGGNATNSGSTVQFVADGATANVNLAINRPEEFCQNNPTLVTCRFNQGAQNGTFAANPVMQNFAYSSGTAYNDATVANYDNPTAHTLNVPASSLGAVYGLAYNRSTQRIYASAYYKRYVGFGSGADNTYNGAPATSDDAGAVYVVNPANGAFVSRFTVPGATVNNHSNATADDTTNASWDAVGKTSLGGIAIADDNSSLFVMNLQNRTLYALNPTTGVSTGNQAIPTPANCPAADVRPFALKYYRGNLYAGMVCSAESTQSAANLRAYVYQVNPATLAFGTTPYSFQLNYNRGFNEPAQNGGANTFPDEWRPWLATIRSDAAGNYTYPQPMLTDIEFDKGNMVLGIRDRLGDQGIDVGFTTGFRPAGDVLRSCGAFTAADFPGTLTLEANGRCGGTGTAPQNTGQGPGATTTAAGSGEFYFNDDYSAPANSTAPHDEVLSGGLLHIPGYNQTISTVFDPISATVANEPFDQGFRWLDSTTGATTKAYRLFDGDGQTSTGGEFGKANGLGDVIPLCDSAPIEIGNRVWRDTNGNGIQDPNESRAIGAGYVSLAGIVVNLYNSSNVLIATAVTDQDGEYYFTSGTAADPNTTDNVGIVNGQITPNTNYQIRFDSAANYATGGVLNGLLMTTRDQTSQAGFDEGSDSDASLVVNPTNSPSGTFPVIPVTTGAAGSNNHDLDVGFTSAATFSLGNRVWFDTNNDGQINAGEAGIGNVSVSVFLDANGDGTPDTPGTPAATQNTDANGYYRFDGLAANNYVVRINPTNFANGAVLSGYANTAGSSNADLDSTATAGQNGENGINPTGAANTVQTNGILSGSVALGAPGEPVNETDVQAAGQGAVDAAANMTVDFGFYRMSLSGTVWNDTGAGANNNNGILDSGETGIQSIAVRLYDSANVEIPVGPDGILGTTDDSAGGMITNSSGNYAFQGLAPGTYRVVVFSNGGTSSTPTQINADGNVDNDDNGFLDNTGFFPGRIISGLVVLTPGGEPTVNNANGTTTNSTVDFGFVLAPSAVKLETFETSTDTTGGVTIKWTTGGEASNLGFNIYREVGGKRSLVNSSLIAGSALRSNADLQANAESYSWYDDKSEPGAVYYLEDVDLNGNSEMHGASLPVMNLSSQGDRSNSKLLNSLNNTSVTAKQTDFALEQSRAVKSKGKFDVNSAASQTGVKISVNRDGWYAVSADELARAGFNTATNRENWQLKANGEQIPFKLRADGSIEFFGRGQDTASTATQMYYLVNGNSAGRRIGESKNEIVGQQPAARSFINAATLRERSLYASGLLNGDAENWFGAVIGSTVQTAQHLTVYDPDNAGQARLSVKLQGLTMTEHLVALQFNGYDLGTISLANRENRAFDFSIPMSAVVAGDNRITMQSVGAGNDISVVDRISLNYSRLYQAQDDRLRFSVAAGYSAHVGGFSSENVEVYEIRGGLVGNQIVTNGVKVDDAEGFTLAAADYDREFLAVAAGQFDRAAEIQAKHSSDWRNASNQADFVIITPQAFVQSARTLAEMRERQGLKTVVVPIEDLYDEYTAGSHSPEAVKEFLRTAASAWKVKPKFALFFGDSSYDPKNYLGGLNRDLIPAKLIDTEYLETASDAWYADFDNDGIEDIALGRLPVASTQEAVAMVEKLARYDQSARSAKSDLLIADNGFESQNEALRLKLAGDVKPSVINRTGMTDADVREAVLNGINGGATVVTYSGHGSPSVWTSSNILRASDAAGLSNGKLSLYLMMTCLNGFTHNAAGDSLAESLIKSPNGAIAVWASSGTTLPVGHNRMSLTATELIFGTNGQRLGAIVRASKQSTEDVDARRTWMLIGDPTVVIR